MHVRTTPAPCGELVPRSRHDLQASQAASGLAARLNLLDELGRQLVRASRSARRRRRAPRRPAGSAGSAARSPPSQQRAPRVMPFVESSTATHGSGSTPSRRAASRYTSGAGLPRATSSDESVTAKQPGEPRQLQEQVDDLPVRRRGEPERPARGEPLDRLDRPVDQRQALAVDLLEARHDRVRDRRRARGRRRARRAGRPTTRASSCPSCRGAPPRASARRARVTSSSLASFQTCSESSSTPSRSKTTAAVTERPLLVLKSITSGTPCSP